MSGICGIVGFGGWRPHANELGPIMDRLKRRGPDRANWWEGEGVSLGHTLLTTTPEAAGEPMPLHHGESDCTITADARLDNRDDLIRELAIDADVVGDGELILRAYLKWEDDCPKHLLGDFAFAIWDGRQQRLFCARDQMGVRQLTYAHLPGRAFVFATEPDAVVRHPLVPKRINEARIADFLDELEDAALSESFYATVTRLIPAHSLAIDEGGLSVRRYWQVNVPPQLTLRTDRDYCDAFLEVFENAVRSRLRLPSVTGVMLSGGLDSGSVASVAARILASEGSKSISTFSVVSDVRDCRETRAIQASIQMPGLNPHLICYSNLGEYASELAELTRGDSEPFDGQMGLVRTAYLAAHRAGLKIVLDGGAADVVFAPCNQVARLLRKGQGMKAWREAVQQEQFWGEIFPARREFPRALWAAWAPGIARRARRRASSWLQDRVIGRRGLLGLEFARTAGLRSRRQVVRDRALNADYLGPDARADLVTSGGLVVGGERYDRVASALAIEPRDPYRDLRLINFALSLPESQLQSDGWPKILIRRAMAGLLPDAVRWRRGKQHLGLAFTRSFFAESFPNLTLNQIQDIVRPYVRWDAVSGPAMGIDDDDQCRAWLKVVSLYHWLYSQNESLGASVR